MAYEVDWYPFSEHPESDSCWSLSTGPDGRVYAAACAERSPGGVAKIVRHDDSRDALEYLFPLDQVTDDPHDSGRATQCKVHYSFAPSRKDGILYLASHLSGPPIDRPAYSPWGSWHDAERCFRGSALVAFDTTTDRVLWWDTLIPKEGCRCLAIDDERGRLYAVGYPRDHFYVYDIGRRERRDLGRIGSINAQAVFLDRRRRVWTSCDDGRLVRYDPETDRLERSPHVLPHNPLFQTGWHGVLYDVVAAPDGESVFGCTWIAQPRLFRFWPEGGEWGRILDLGPATQDRDPTIPVDTFVDHCGGFVVGGDGRVYYVASRWRDPVYNPMRDSRREREGVVWRIDPATHEKEEVALLERPDEFSQYVSRGAIDRNGDLFFGHVGPRPVGIFRLRLPEDRKRRDPHLPLRVWG